MNNYTAATVFGDRIITFRVHVGSRRYIKNIFPDMKNGQDKMMGLVIATKNKQISHFNVEVLVKSGFDIRRIPFSWINLNTIDLVSEADHIIFKLEVEDSEEY